MKARLIRTEAGFALVETLIAAAIIATMTGVFFQIIASHAHSVQAMADRRAAAMVARSALDAAIGDNEGILARRGTDSRLQWQVTIDPYEPRAGTAPPLDIVTVTVTVTGARRPVLRLSSLRVGR
jgi:type II secretory pathway pseudopilin PulG